MSHVSIFKEVIAKREEMVQEQQQELREVQDGQHVDQEILQCVMKGLAGYGDDVPKMVVYNLKWMSKIRREEIPDKAEEFEKCLDEIFDSGSAFIKKSIIEEIKAKFGLTHDYKSLKDAFESAALMLREM
ncbi:MAG: hypothetical protein ABSE82_12530 [Nitrososphaerales archaeon]